MDAFEDLLGRRDDGPSQEELQMRRRELQATLTAAVHDLAATDHGMAFLRWTLAQCGVFEQAYPSNRLNEAYIAGRREFGLNVLALCVRDGCTAAVLDDLREVDIDV